MHMNQRAAFRSEVILRDQIIVKQTTTSIWEAIASPRSTATLRSYGISPPRSSKQRWKKVTKILLNKQEEKDQASEQSPNGLSPNQFITSETLPDIKNPISTKKIHQSLHALQKSST